VELARETPSPDRSRLDFDELDLRCSHLIVIDQLTLSTVGTYRVNSIGTGGIPGFYSHSEFSIEDLPATILRNGVEIGRACIAPEHRNTKVLFLLFKGLASYLAAEGKRYFFGCCSIFTRDETVGAAAYAQLLERNCVERRFAVNPRRSPVDLRRPAGPVNLPDLFNMYLRIGARVCGPPMIDHDFGTIDFFVVCDTRAIAEKYQRMFFDNT
jgi:putative hemolysin